MFRHFKRRKIENFESEALKVQVQDDNLKCQLKEDIKAIVEGYLEGQNGCELPPKIREECKFLCVSFSNKYYTLLIRFQAMRSHIMILQVMESSGVKGRMAFLLLPERAKSRLE